MYEETIRDQWGDVLNQIGIRKTGTESLLMLGIEQHIHKILELCPVGSRVSVNVNPGIIVACKKEQGSVKLTMRWLITDCAEESDGYD